MNEINDTTGIALYSATLHGPVVEVQQQDGEDAPPAAVVTLDAEAYPTETEAAEAALASIGWRRAAGGHWSPAGGTVAARVEPAHHTAWVTTTEGETVGEHADVEVLVDDVILAADGTVLERSSTADSAVGPVALPTRADAQDLSAVPAEADAALDALGWEPEGPWYVVDSGFIASVRPRR